MFPGLLGNLSAVTPILKLPVAAEAGEHQRQHTDESVLAVQLFEAFSCDSNLRCDVLEKVYQPTSPGTGAIP